MNWIDPNYEVPKSSGNYLKFEDGDNKFRVLTSPIMGWQYWNKDNKPVRLREQPKRLPEDIRYTPDKKTGEQKAERVKHFWCFAAWNYAEKRVQVVEVTQATIQNQMLDLALAEDWGDPRNYDLTVKRKGEGFDTEYSVQPSPAKPLNAEAQAMFDEATLNLDALFDNGDPFMPARPASMGGRAELGEVSADEEFATLTEEELDKSLDAIVLNEPAPAPVSPVGRKPKSVK